MRNLLHCFKNAAKNQHARNATANAIAYLARPAALLLLTPVLLSRLGVTTSGVWVVCQSLLALGAIADMGIAPATTLFISRTRGVGDNQSLIRLIRVSLAIYLPLTLLFSILFLATAPGILPLFQVFPQNIENPTLLMASLSVALGFQLLQGMFSATLAGLERYDIDASITFFHDLLSLTCVLLFALLGKNLSHIILVQCVFRVLANGAAAFALTRLLNSHAWALPCWDPHLVRSLFSVGLYGWIQSLAGFLFTQSDKLILASFANTSLLVYYYACVQIAQISHGILAKSLAFLFPKFASMDLGNHRELLRVFNKGMKLSTLAGGISSLFLFFLGPEILRLWLKTELPPGTETTLQLLAAANAFMATSILPYSLLLGAGLFRASSLFAIISGLSVACSALALAPNWGILGAAASKFSMLPVSFLSRLYVFRSVLKQPPFRPVLLQFTPVLAMYSPFLLFWGLFPSSFSDWRDAPLLTLLLLLSGLALLLISSRLIYSPSSRTP